MIENDVSQQGGDDTALRGTDVSRLKDTELHHARPKKFLDETKDVAIGDFGSHRLHNDLVREVIEEGFDIGVENDVETRVVEDQRASNSRVAVASGPEAEGRIVEQGFKDRGEERTNNLLSNPIANGRNAQRAELRVVLRNENPAERERLERAVL